jgi:hypothetical protein
MNDQESLRKTEGVQPGLPSATLLGRTVEWEIVLSGGHPDIFVIISAPENATDAELQSLAEIEAMAKTYIWSKKRVRPNIRS